MEKQINGSVIGVTDDGYPIVTEDYGCPRWEAAQKKGCTQECWYCKYADFRKSIQVSIHSSVCRCPENRVDVDSGFRKNETEAAGGAKQVSAGVYSLEGQPLDVVAGGAYAGDGRKIVTVGYWCGNWGCKQHNHTSYQKGIIHRCNGYDHIANCGNCMFCVYEGGLWLCNEPNYKF